MFPLAPAIRLRFIIVPYSHGLLSDVFFLTATPGDAGNELFISDVSYVPLLFLPPVLLR